MVQRLDSINVEFDVQNHGAHVYFDPVSQQPLLAFNFALKVAVPQMLQCLLGFTDGSFQTAACQYKVDESNVQGPSPTVPPVTAPSPARSWPPQRRREPPPPPPDTSMAMMPMSEIPPPLAPGVTPVFAKNLPCKQAPPPPAPPPAAPPAQPLAPGMTPVFAKNLACMQAPPPPPPPAPPVVPDVTPMFSKNLACTQAPPPSASCVQSPEIDALARGNTPQGGFTEFVAPCLPPEGPPVPAAMSDICTPEILGMHKDEDEVHSIAFGDTELDKVIFQTDASIGCFSLQQNRLVSKHNLNSKHLDFRIRCMAVNPASGAISCLVEAPIHGDGQGDGHFESIIIVWPNGILHEEPLKLRISQDACAADLMPSAIVSSAVDAPLVIMSRICTRKVFWWRFVGQAGTVEMPVAIKGGLIAISSTGHWLAVVEDDDYENHYTKVWYYDSLSEVPSLVSSLDRNPRTIAIAHQGDTALLALSDGCPMGPATLPVEVLAIQPDGRASCMYRFEPESPCWQLSFCFDDPKFLLCARDDGVISLHNLSVGTAAMHADDAKIRSVCMSPNRQLILSACDNVFRVYQAAEPAA